MYSVGIDIGYTSMKIVIMDSKSQVIYSDYRFHKGILKETIHEMLHQVSAKYDLKQIRYGAVTGSGSQFIQGNQEVHRLNDISALVEGSLFVSKDIKSIVEIGGQSAAFISNVTKTNKKDIDISINSSCSAGTGSFLEEQANRLQINISEYAQYALNATDTPRIAGRCSVFAKTDIIHHQQEGVSVENILMGLAKAVAKNYKSMIVKNHEVRPPVFFAGGVVKNQAMIESIKTALKIKDSDLVYNNYSEVVGAIGAAKVAYEKKYEIDCEKLLVGEFLENRDENSNQNSPLISYGQNDSVDKHSININTCKKEGYLGIDIGSTSTNLVVLNDDNQVISYQYLRTLGDPITAVKTGLLKCMEDLGESFRLKGIGTTGSGRMLIGNKLDATVIKDEITAQGTATMMLDPEIDTIFEIGGQDSKYISIDHSRVHDFQMNKVCAAGTGAFIEEQAKKLDMDLETFASKSLVSDNPLDLGERCTVFIESSIMSNLTKGASGSDIAAGLCYSIARNYLNKVVGQKKIGNKISFQGGLAYNQGVVNAFRVLSGKEIHVLPYFSVTGALGVAKLSKDKALEINEDKAIDELIERLDNNTKLDKKKDSNLGRKIDPMERLFLDGYTDEIDKNKQTVGIPRVLFLHKLFPAFNTFFRELGYNTILTELTNDEIVTLSNEYALSDACYPIKLVHGHVAKLVEQKVDYIFLPSLLTMKHEISRTRCNYGCTFMQSVSKIVEQNIDIKSKGIKLLSPTLSFQFGKKHMMESMVKVGKELGKNPIATVNALQKGMLKLNQYIKEVEKQGQKAVDALKDGERAFVIITRAYGVKDPILNMQIPQTLKKMGHKVITLSHLPAHDIDLSLEHENMYWPFGQHMISGAQIVREHPNLYAIYLTNHGCGPDTVISKFFDEEMKDKPYLHIEVDEHASSVGVITRIEAFMNSLDDASSKIKNSSKPLDYYTTAIDHKSVNLEYSIDGLDKNNKLLLPYLYPYTELFAAYLKQKGYNPIVLPRSNTMTLEKGLEYTTTKEAFSMTAMVGDILCYLDRIDGKNKFYTIMIPTNEGSEVQGQYNRVIRSVLNQSEYRNTKIIAPFIEDIIYDENAFEVLSFILLAGDLVMLAHKEQRKDYLDNIIQIIADNKMTVSSLKAIAMAIKEGWEKIEFKKKILAVGETSIVFNEFLHHFILDNLEVDNYLIMRNPLSEYMLAYFRQHITNKKHKHHSGGKSRCDELYNRIFEIHNLLGDISPFTPVREYENSMTKALQKGFYGGNGYYRYFKINYNTGKWDGIINMASMYENTNTIVKMLSRNQRDKERIPVLDISFEQLLNEQLKLRLESFLYYLS